MIILSYADLAGAASLILINAGLSLWLRLQVERQLLISALRMVVQLGLMALVLTYLFRTVSPWLTLLAVVVMLAFAAYEIHARQRNRLAGVWGYGVGMSAVVFAGVLVTILALTTQVRPEPWYHPRYAIPLLGMILGNAMTAISLTLDNMLQAVERERPAIEGQIALGATRQVAMKSVMRGALRAGMIPTINGMAAAGVVSLPGMMTGQILSGIDPVEAVKYQILIMFLISAAAGLGCLAGAYVALYRLTDTRHRLRLDRVRRADGEALR